MKLLMLGDVNGAPGRRMVKEHVRRLKRELGLAAVVANAENAAAEAFRVDLEHGRPMQETAALRKGSFQFIRFKAGLVRDNQEPKTFATGNRGTVELLHRVRNFE